MNAGLLNGVRNIWGLELVKEVQVRNKTDLFA
jgi:hypothetical protein